MVDEDLCNGCGVCAEERCPARAIRVEDEKAAVDIEKCIGCGLCVTGCPNDALRLLALGDFPEPPVTTSEMGMRILQEKGKLERFLEVLNP